MQNFIVLGIIPGTSVQTTFQFWVIIALSIIGLVALFKLYRRRYLLQARLAARKIDRFIAQYQLQA